ncbi:MAG: ROK family glucokinase [Clostridia bacterium]|nr:ROK family glucokinase [Clostridia bacterium]
MYTIGIDLGGTNIATAVVDENCKIIGEAKTPTNCPRPAEEIAADMIKTVFAACENAKVSIDDIQWIGIGAPGCINQDTGVIEYSNNLQFENVPMIEMIEKGTGKKCYMENDANAAAYGELIAGAGKGSKDFIAITLGTGVGGGIIIDGKIFSGSNYFGAELGHTGIVVDGEPCNCGINGCWEAYASATALIRQTKRAMEANKDSAMWQIAGSLDKVNGRTAFDGMRMGDKTATAVVDKYIEYVAYGIVNVINIFQPEFICIGGGISKENDTLLNPIKAYVEKYRYSKYAKKQTEIKIAKLGNDAGIIGAAMLGRLH